MLALTLPMWALYEVGILLCRRAAEQPESCPGIE
jgi:Sec-independent protein secretion pathway component TatC